MANRVGQKVFPRAARRQEPLTAGTCVQIGDSPSPAFIYSVRKKLKYARRYEVAAWGDVFLWLRRDEFTVVPCN